MSMTTGSTGTAASLYPGTTAPPPSPASSATALAVARGGSSLSTPRSNR